MSQAGDLWRWDGFTSAADAPSPAARRLSEKNRLADLEREAKAAREAAKAARRSLEAESAAARQAAQAESAAIEAAKQARRGVDQAREQLTVAERKAAETLVKRSTLAEAIKRLG